MSSFLLFVLLSLNTHPSTAQPTIDRERPVATIGSDTLTVADFERSYIAYLISTGANDTPTHRYRHLNALIDQHLLAEEAKKRGLDTGDAYHTYAERALKKALGTRFFERTALDSLPPPTDAELREAFVRSKQQVAVRHLFYRDVVQAQAAYERLRAGHDFLREAQEAYGLAAVDSSAGYLGLIRYFEVDDAFAEVAFDLELGDYSEPFRSRYGYHIVRVEEKIVMPILTESEYQTRKDGVASQVRQRRRRLEGDQFVRAFMQEREVHVDAQGVAALALAIQDLTHTVAPRPVSVDQSVEVESIDPAALRAVLRPDTPLATYVLNGQSYTFTAGDYYFWLPDLPFEEAQHRTVASVGRALRNEVLARAGEQQGLKDDLLVQRELQERTRAYLSSALLEALRQDHPPALEDGLLELAYEQFGSLLPISEDTEEEQREQFRQHLAPFLNEMYLLRDLRVTAEFQIYESIYN